jgi:enolase
MQEFMLLPTGAKTFKEAMRMGSEVYHHLKNLYDRFFNYPICFCKNNFLLELKRNMVLMQLMLVMKVVLHQISKMLKEVINICKRLFVLLKNFVALDLLVKAIETAGYTGKIQIGMDVAASEFYDEQEKRYDLNNKEKGHPNYVNNNMKKKNRT